MCGLCTQAASDLQAAGAFRGEGLGLRVAPLDQVHGLKNLVDVSSAARALGTL